VGAVPRLRRVGVDDGGLATRRPRALQIVH
jgi:hypothetical protein